MTEQEMQSLHQKMIDTANLIKTNADAAARKHAVREQKREAKELRRAQILAQIAANRVLYTNAEQREAALVEQTFTDNDFLLHHAAEREADNERKAAEAEVELNRKIYRADELLMLYHASR